MNPIDRRSRNSHQNPRPYFVSAPTKSRRSRDAWALCTKRSLLPRLGCPQSPETVFERSIRRSIDFTRPGPRPARIATPVTMEKLSRCQYRHRRNDAWAWAYWRGSRRQPPPSSMPRLWPYHLRTVDRRAAVRSARTWSMSPFDAPVYFFSPRQPDRGAESKLYEWPRPGRYDGVSRLFSANRGTPPSDMAGTAFQRDGKLSGVATGWKQSPAIDGRACSRPI